MQARIPFIKPSTLVWEKGACLTGLFNYFSLAHLSTKGWNRRKNLSLEAQGFNNFIFKTLNLNIVWFMRCD